MIDQVPHNRLTYTETEVAAVTEVVRSGHWAGGAKMREMEAKLGVMFEMEHVAAVGSGIAALRLALLGVGVGGGDEVIVPAYSCVALANAVLSVGARPIVADVEEMTWNISVDDVKRRITNKTRAVIAVNTFGVPAPVTELKKTGLKIIEDASHGFACDASGEALQMTADVAVFSFYATKLIGGGEGGAVLSSDVNIGAFVRQWRDYTDQAPDGSRLNDKITDLESSLVLTQLQRLTKVILERRHLADRYRQRLVEIGGIGCPVVTNDRVWYRYVVELPSSLSSVIDRLRDRGVSTCRPVEWWPDSAGEFVVAYRAFESLLSLPLYPTLSNREQEYVCDVLEEVLSI